MKNNEIIKSILCMGMTNENCGVVKFGAADLLDFDVETLFGDVKNWAGIQPDTEYLYIWLPGGAFCPFGDPDAEIDTADGDVIYLIKMED